MSAWPQIHKDAYRRQHIGENFFVHHSFTFKKTMSLLLRFPCKGHLTKNPITFPSEEEKVVLLQPKFWVVYFCNENCTLYLFLKVI